MSTTLTVRVTSAAAFPLVSDTLKATEYIPTIAVSTLDRVTILEVISPSLVSAAVAPASM